MKFFASEEAGISNFDSSVWRNPPPEIRTAITLPSGIAAVAFRRQERSDSTQEIQAKISNAMTLWIMPQGSLGVEWFTNNTVSHGTENHTIALTSPRRQSRIIMREGVPELIQIYFPIQKYNHLMNDLKTSDITDGLFSPCNPFSLLAQAFVADLYGDISRNPILFETHAILLARRLVLNFSNPRPARGGLAPWQVKVITEYIHENLSRPLELLELATVLKLSPCHFARSFKISVGLPPRRFLSKLRLERAKALLSEDTLSTSAIALAVGYASAQSLGRALRQGTKSSIFNPSLCPGNRILPAFSVQPLEAYKSRLQTAA